MIRGWLLLLALLVSAGCATTKRVTETGVASWYGPDFHGKRTASGETYDQHELTAAHKTLPFGSIVRVTNIENGKSVDVRINDRGPYSRGRIIDVSRAAAVELDMIRSGTARVRVYVLKAAGPIIGELSVEMFTVQVASYADEELARTVAADLRGGWVHPVRVNGTRYYRVYVGRFGDRQQAEAALAELKRQGVDGFVKQVQN